MSSDLIEIAGRIHAFMRRSMDVPHSEEEFNRLALELYALQLDNNPAFAQLCPRLNRTFNNWRDIPAAPTVAFKELEMTSLASEERTTLFFSSGTTQSDRSRHFHSALSKELYEQSLWLWFERNFAEKMEGLHFLALTPTAAETPNSSLVHMFETIGKRSGAQVQFAGTIDRDGGWALNFGKALNCLSAAEKAKTPVAIFGTAFLFVHLLDELEKTGTNVRLPERSWVLETGGYKGRTRAVPKPDLHRLITERLGIPAERIFGEYGMSELGSQAYAGVDAVFRFPPWAQAVLISPATGREAREGERGLIRIYDLANVWSVMSVQTEDVGIKVGGGIRLLGRAPQAEARGCSLMAA